MPSLLFFTKKGCPNCDSIKSTFFENDNKHPKLNDLECRTLHAESEEDKEVFELYKVRKIIPAVKVLENGKVIKEFQGSINPFELCDFLLNEML